MSTGKSTPPESNHAHSPGLAPDSSTGNRTSSEENVCATAFVRPVLHYIVTVPSDHGVAAPMGVPFALLPSPPPPPSPAKSPANSAKLAKSTAFMTKSLAEQDAELKTFLNEVGSVGGGGL